MPLTRRDFTAGLGSATLAIIARPALADTAITLAFSPANDFLPVFVAKDQGYFGKRGLDATLQLVPLAPSIPGAIRGGSITIGSITPPAFLQSNENGLDLVAICGATIESKKNPTVSVVVRKDSGIKSPADFAGKAVGVPGFNSELDIVFRKWLKDGKVNLAAVNFRELPFPAMNDQLNAKTIDAVVVLEPFRDRILKAGSGENFANFFDDVRDNLGFVYWTSTREWADTHPTEIASFRAAVTEGVAYIAKNPAPAREIETKYLKVASPAFSTYTTEVKAADLQWYYNVGRDLGMLKKPVDVSKLIYAGK
jgi:NitT/TauT family transport system substrate-binding protein